MAGEPEFEYDVFISHSSKDKPVVVPLAQRLKDDGLRVWLDEWEIKPGEHIGLAIEHGLESSRVILFCMSKDAFDSDWVRMEGEAFRFRDPVNKERRFIPVRLDEAPIRNSLRPYSYVSWLPDDRERSYSKVLEACRLSQDLETEGKPTTFVQGADRTIQLDRDPSSRVYFYAFSPDGTRAITGGHDRRVQLWDLETGRCSCALEGHTLAVFSVAWSADQRRALSGASDTTVRLWDLEAGRCLRVLEGHTGGVYSVAWSADQRRALSGASDTTVRLWDLGTGRCLRVLEGHTEGVYSVAWSADQRRALSGGQDKTVRLWDLETGRCLRVLEGHTGDVWSVAWSADQRRALSGDESGGVQVWGLSDFLTETRTTRMADSSPLPAADRVTYTNAKVLLVGESGAGKTGLSMVLAGKLWEPSDSTVGAWATQWTIPTSQSDGGQEGVEREIWLWDFGGQADQRLIHQLYMDDTAVAVLVFDGQKADVFDTLGQWDRDLTRASRRPFTKLLAAGRVDAGGLRISKSRLEAFAKERGFTDRLFETSAKARFKRT